MSVHFWATGAVLAAIVTTAPLPAAAQVIKPRPALGGDRLPAPQGVTARQLPDGRIQLTWGTVADAAGYQIARSVPPAGTQVLPVTAGEDTVYIDADVKPGSTYYYQVAALNATGGLGLKAGSAPVTAKEHPDTAVVTPPPVEALAPPEYLRVVQFPFPEVTFHWTYPKGDLAYLIERTLVGMQKEALGWTPVIRTPKLPCCAMTAKLSEKGTDRFARVRYRITVLDPAVPRRRSPPKESETINPGEPLTWGSPPGYFMLPPVPGREITLKVGKYSGFGRSPDQTHHLVSLDEGIVRVDPYGNFIAKAAGVTYVFYVEPGGGGAPYVEARRVTVLP